MTNADHTHVPRDFAHTFVAQRCALDGGNIPRRTPTGPATLVRAQANRTPSLSILGLVLLGGPALDLQQLHCWPPRATQQHVEQSQRPPHIHRADETAGSKQTTGRVWRRAQRGNRGRSEKSGPRGGERDARGAGKGQWLVVLGR